MCLLIDKLNFMANIDVVEEKLTQSVNFMATLAFAHHFFVQGKVSQSENSHYFLNFREGSLTILSFLTDIQSAFLG